MTQQLLHQTIYEASRRNRLIEGGVTASRGGLSTNLLYQRNEVVNGVTNTIVYGSTPRATAALAPQRLFQSPVYASVNADYAFLAVPTPISTAPSSRTTVSDGSTYHRRFACRSRD